MFQDKAKNVYRTGGLNDPSAGGGSTNGGGDGGGAGRRRRRPGDGGGGGGGGGGDAGGMTNSEMAFMKRYQGGGEGDAGGSDSNSSSILSSLEQRGKAAQGPAVPRELYEAALEASRRLQKEAEVRNNLLTPLKQPINNL